MCTQQRRGRSKPCVSRVLLSAIVVCTGVGTFYGPISKLHGHFGRIQIGDREAIFAHEKPTTYVVCNVVYNHG